MSRADRRNRRFSALVLAALLAAGSSPAAAGDFCAVGLGAPPQCLYDDVTSCASATAPPNSFCAVNPDARLYYDGSARVCAVQSDRIAQCLFATLAECNEAHFEAPVVCLDRTERADELDPFRYDRRIGNQLGE